MQNTLNTRSPLQQFIESSTALARRSELLFVVLISLSNIAVGAAADCVISRFGVQEVERPELLRLGVAGLFWIAVVFAPLIETMLLQQIPIVTARRFGASAGVQFAMGSIPFAVLHFSAGASGIAAGVTGGIFLAIVYLTFVSQSKSKAFWMTAAVHALHNLASFILFIRNLP